MRNADVAVISGGIVGLAMADANLAARPGTRVTVFDKEPRLAAHASGRNSGVLHAGFYYAPDSLKARLTRRGNSLLHAFIEERGLRIRRCGKVVVAQEESELPALLELLRRGLANGVDVELVDGAGLAELEPLARTCGQALWSPTTSVADPVAVVEELAARVRERGGRVLLSAPVTYAEPGLVVSGGDRWSAGHVVNCAGLHADTVARWFGMNDDYVMLPFKGLYWYGDWQPGRLRRHVYPVPDPRNPFLGVHLTVTVDGRAKIGPTAIPALWREDYGGLAGFDASEARGIATRYPRFLRSPHHDVLGLVRAEVPKYWRRHLVRQAARLVPSVDPRDFTIKGRPGVRAQLFHVPTARLEMDFVVRGDARSTHVLNAVSPAWTSSLAVSEHVVDGMVSRGVVRRSQASTGSPPGRPRHQQPATAAARCAYSDVSSAGAVVAASRRTSSAVSPASTSATAAPTSSGAPVGITAPEPVAATKARGRGRSVTTMNSPTAAYSYSLLGIASTNAGVGSSSEKPTHAPGTSSHASAGGIRPWKRTLPAADDVRRHSASRSASAGSTLPTTSRVQSGESSKARTIAHNPREPRTSPT